MSDSTSSNRQFSDLAATVRTLAEVMRVNGLTKADIQIGDVSIKLRAETVREIVSPLAPQVEIRMPAQVQIGSVANEHVVTAPMIGTFYLTPAPGEPAFVRVGDRIDIGQTIGIIEAMKIMNEIPSDRAGTVTEILVANAQAVEYGSPLLKIVPDEGGQ